MSNFTCQDVDPTCSNRGTCLPTGFCVCSNAWNPEDYCSTPLSKAYGGIDVAIYSVLSAFFFMQGDSSIGFHSRDHYSHSSFHLRTCERPQAIERIRMGHFQVQSHHRQDVSDIFLGWYGHSRASVPSLSGNR